MKTLTKHTPGPWHIRNGQNEGELHICAPGKTIAVCNSLPVNLVEANACLIAAAPELLEACKFAYQAMLKNPKFNIQEGKTSKDACDILKQTISKAYGEQ